MDILTVLKLARLTANKVAEERPTEVLKVKVGEEKLTVSLPELVKELDALIKQPAVCTHTCETCDFIKFPEKGEAMCYPKNYTSWRKRADYCSFHSKVRGKI